MINSDRIEIIDLSGENFKRFSIPCSVFIIGLALLAILSFTLMFIYPESLIGTYLSLLIVFSFVLYFFFIVNKNPGKIRKFCVSSSEIEITTPNNPIFKICWPNFEKIEVRLRTFNYQPYHRYEFHFTSKNNEKTCNFTLFDFSREKISQILIILKDFTGRMKKQFVAVKEKMISGVILVENLKI